MLDHFVPPQFGLCQPWFIGTTSFDQPSGYGASLQLMLTSSD